MKGCSKGFHAHLMDCHPGPPEKNRFIRREGAPRILTSAEKAREYFRETSWEEALDLAASPPWRFQRETGMYIPAGPFQRRCLPWCFFIIMPTQTARFLTQWGGATRNLSSYSSGAASFALPPYIRHKNRQVWMRGIWPTPKMIILWGYNAIDTRFGCEMPPPSDGSKKSGGSPLFVIDPRRTRTVKIPRKPGGFPSNREETRP